LRLVIPTSDAGELTFYGENQALSPDGRMLAVVTVDSAGTSQLSVRNLETGEIRPLVNDAFAPFWSPDARWIGFFGTEQHVLSKISVAGGTPVTLAPAPTGRGGTWRGDVILYAPDAEGPIYRVASGGGDTVAVTHLDAASHESGHRFPSFLP